MAKLDPIIAVKNVRASAAWYQSVFECKNEHGGDNFAVLVDSSGDVLVCLHQWGEHRHPTMINPEIMPGNGLILYYKTEQMDVIRQNVDRVGHPLEEEIHLNPNSTKKEFSFRDPDGYYWIITELHQYDG